MSSYPFVRSASDYGIAKGARLGIVWHMAEGGGTVGYLSRPNPNNVSVHFVIERTGRTVQMLDLIHANGSLNPTLVRKTDDKPYAWAGEQIIYGRTAAKAVLGRWADDPNSATLGVEIEGYAKDGPNASQTTAMEDLYADMASRFDGLRSLGHRDFANYKACPGRLIPWHRVGGHGPEVDMATAINGSVRVMASDWCRDVREGTVIYRDTTGARLTAMSRDATLDDFGVPMGGGGWAYVGVASAGFDEDADVERGLALVKVGDVGPLRRKSPDELAATAARYGTVTADCLSAVEQAITADRLKAYVGWKD